MSAEGHHCAKPAPGKTLRVLCAGFDPDCWPRWLLYGIAVTAVAAAILIRLGIEEMFDERPLLIIFVLPILLSAYLGGLGPGLLATAAAAAGIEFFLIPPTFSFAVDKFIDLAQWLVLIVTGAAISILTETLHRFRRRVEAGRLQQAVTLASIGDAVITTDKAGRVTFLNPEAERLTGWSLPEAAGQPLAKVFRIIKDQTGQAAADPVSEILQEKTPAAPPRGAGLLSRDGRELNITLRGAPIKQPDGPGLGMVLVFRDCSEERQAQAALRESERHYRSLFDNMLNGFVFCKMMFEDGKPVDFIYLNVNRAFSALTGLSDVVGKKATEVMPGIRESDPGIFIAHGRVALTGQPETLEIYVNALQRWVSATLYSPEKGYFVSIFEDVTARKQAEAALRESEDRLRLFIAYAPASLAMFDRDMRYLSVSRRWCTEYQLGDKNILGLSHYEVFPDIPERWREVHRRGLMGEVVVSEDDRFDRADGTWLISRWEVRPWFDAAGAVGGIVIFSEDITERKEAEAALRRSLEEKTALLKEVHHRVKNNLQIVISLLKMQAGRSPHPEVVEVLEKTCQRVHSMALLHETLYRSENLARINFAVFVGELYRHLQRSAGAVTTRVELVNRVAPISLPLEMSLPCGLIINELVTNALKHAFPADRPGIITVLLESAPNRQLILRVTDNGVGPPPFRDLAAGTTLGLRLVNGLSRQLGGQLTVSQPEGSGTAFQVVFPAPGSEAVKDATA